VASDWPGREIALGVTVYTDSIHYREPRNVGKPEAFNVEGLVGDRSAGPFMVLYLDIGEDRVIRSAGFETYGCNAAIAAGSFLTEAIKGRLIDELTMGPEALKEGLGSLPLSKEHCVFLALGALAHAVVDWKRKRA
jgi:nitrogen fixation NifU-like protein